MYIVQWTVRELTGTFLDMLLCLLEVYKGHELGAMCSLRHLRDAQYTDVHSLMLKEHNKRSQMKIVKHQMKSLHCINLCLGHSELN